MATVSFSIKKAESSKVIKTDSNDEKKIDYVLELAGREIKSTLPKQEKKELVIKMIGKNNWRGTSLIKDTDTGKESKSSEELALDKEAADAVIRDMSELRAAGNSGDDSNPVIPLLLQNKPPVVEGREKDELADVDLRPEQSTLEQYDTVPIESYGVAMLKGMGWKEGTAVGLTNKGLVEPIEFTSRIDSRGLGATPRAPPPDTKRHRIKKPGEEEKKKQGPYVGKDGRVKYYKKVGEDIPEQPLRGFVVGNYARVQKGPHKNLTGKIVSADEDSASVVLRMIINGQTLSFDQRHLELVSRDVYLGRTSTDNHSRGAESSHSRGAESSSADNQEKQYGLVTKKGRSNNEPPSKRLKRDSDHSITQREASTSINGIRDKHRHLPHSSAQSAFHHTNRDEAGSSKERDDDKRSWPKERSWLYPNLRVRMVDQRYKKGRHYNTKVVVLDVVSAGVCDCQTDTGKLLEGVTQSMLETVVPRATRSKVMIVGGAKRGQVGTIMEQDRRKARAIVELSMSKEVLQLDFDDICEYTGIIDDEI